MGAKPAVPGWRMAVDELLGEERHRRLVIFLGATRRVARRTTSETTGHSRRWFWHSDW